MRLILNQIVFTIAYFISGVFTLGVKAQVNDPEDENIKIGFLEFEWFEISTVLDLENYGALKTIGYIAAFFVAWAVLYTFYLVFKIAWIYIRSRGDSGDMETAQSTGRELFKGIIVFFVGLALYMLVSIFMGVGNIFRWPEALTQCGDGTPYFQAEYNAEQVLKQHGYSFNDSPSFKTYSYCCETPPVSSSNFSNVVPNDNGEGIYASFTPSDNGSVVLINQDREGGGWFFVNTNLPSPSIIDGECRAIFD